MPDTPPYIKDLLLKIWLAKAPMERLHELQADNEALLKFWAVVKQNGKEAKSLSGNKNLAH